MSQESHTPRIAYVTGAGGTLGSVAAAALSEAGYALALFDRDVAALAAVAERLRDRTATHAQALDITSPPAVAAAIASAMEAVGPADLLVNAAGTFSVVGPLWETEPLAWCRDINVNLYGTYLMCREVVRHMVRLGRGRVINIVSTGGVLDAHPYGTSYASSKTGVTRMTEGLARELDGTGVTAFALAPPAILSNMTRFLMDDPGARKFRPAIKQIFESGADFPPSIVADLVLVLASGQADGLSGRCLLPHEDVAELIRRVSATQSEEGTLRLVRRATETG